MNSLFNFNNKNNFHKKGSEFNVDNLKKYFKNQELPSDLTDPFTDEIFPPNENSIMALNSNGEPIDPEMYQREKNDINPNLQWHRLSEKFPNSQLFEGEIEADDVKQGQIGNCYFLASLAALSEFPNLLFKIFKTKEFNNLGIYEIALFLDGQWQIVIIDDYIPFDTYGRPAFAKPNGNELWVMLLEKAWAKVNGGYLNTIGGIPTECLHTFTAFSKKSFNTQESERSIDELWDIISQSDLHDNILCCATKHSGMEEVGLVPGHAYTLKSAKSARLNGELIRLLEIRNPWGQKEYKGDWSDGSYLWTEEAIKAFDKQENKDDGHFFMKIEDFPNYFDYIYVCYTIFDCNFKFYNFQDDNISIEKPQVFSLKINEDQINTNITINTPYYRFNRDLKDKAHPITLLLAKINSDGSFEYIEGDYSSNDDPSIKKTLDKGNYIIYVYYGVNPNNERPAKNISLKISINSRFISNYEKEDNDFKVLREILISASKISENPNKNIISNLKSTGLGYWIYFNDSENYTMSGIRDNGVSNYDQIYPINKQQNFEFFGTPGAILILIYQSMDLFRGSSLALSMSLCTSSQAFSEDPNNGEDNQFSKSLRLDGNQILSNEILNGEIKDDFYDYTYPSNKEAKVKMSNVHIYEMEKNKEELEQEYPKYMQKLELINQRDEKHLENNWKKLTYDNGFYLGQIDQNGQRAGLGVYVHNKGNYSCGNFKQNIMNGLFMDYNELDELKFEGNYTNNKRNGKGKLIFSKDIIYSGDFKNDVFQGKGEYLLGNGVKYEGDFVDNKKNGKGKSYLEKNEYHEGGYKNDKYHGYGEFKYSSGDLYQGNFENGKKEGKGVYIFKDQGKWEGSFSNDQMNGTGILTDANGETREVNYVDGEERNNCCCLIY